MRSPIRREFAFALFIMLSLTTLALSQTHRVIDYFAGFAEKDSAAEPIATTSAPAPRAEALRLANKILREKAESPFVPSFKSGLWLGGDLAEAFAWLQWIVGPENAELFSLEGDCRVRLDAGRLARAARIDESASGEAPGLLATYISANDGLLLLLQIANSSHRYLLHIGREAPTEGGNVIIKSVLNLDNKFDSRINPHRRNGLKLSAELPPKGFDSLVAINPGIRMLNLRTKLLVPPGNLAFHELAEAHAKLEFGFDYLSQGSRPGAHDTALEREERLLSQRPFADVVVTKGQNCLLRREAVVPRPTSSFKKL